MCSAHIVQLIFYDRYVDIRKALRCYDALRDVDYRQIIELYKLFEVAWQILFDWCSIQIDHFVMGCRVRETGSECRG